MQKTIKILILSIWCFSQAYSQNLLEVGKQWIFEDMHYKYFWYPFYSDTTIETIKVTKDTFINSEFYFKIVTSRKPSCWSPQVVEYLREDGDKIYRLSKDYQQEFLMIDFGETNDYQMLYDNAGTVDTGTVIIDSFGIVYAFDGTPIEVQYMRILNNQSYEDYQPYKVYKNLGFLYPGLLFPDLGTGLCDFQDRITLRCLSIGGDTIHFTEFDCFELQLINNIIPVLPETVTLSPNPATDFVIVPSGLRFLDIGDLYGSTFEPQWDSNRIFLDNIPCGSYIVRFTGLTDNRIYIGRIQKPN